MRDKEEAHSLPVVDLIVRCGVLITVDRDRRILRDAAVVVDNGVIREVGAAIEVADRFVARKFLDRRGDVVTPGFVDAHVHLSHHLIRSSIPDTWPEEREHDIWLPYWLNMTRDDAFHSALLACLEMVLNGTTTFCDMSGRFDAETEAAAVDAVGLRGIVSEVCWDRPPHPDVAIGDTDTCIARLESLVSRFPKRTDSRVWAGIGMSGMGKASDALVVAGSEIARRHHLVLYMHQSFAAADTLAYQQQASGRLAVEHLAHLGVLGPELQLVHMIRTEPSEVALLAEFSCNVVHCPGASIRWGMGATRGLFPEMIEAGVNVGLGSDSANYSDAFNIGRQAYLAATIHREARGVTTISAGRALEMATVNGARAMGAEDFIGSVEAGKRADIVVHDGRRPEWHPNIDPVASLIYAAQSTGVRDVIVDGEVILEDRQFTRLEVDRLLAVIDKVARGLAERMGLDALRTSSTRSVDARQRPEVRRG